MRKHLGPLALIFLLPVLALTLGGVAYGRWAEATYIDAHVNTGDLNWELRDHCCLYIPLPDECCLEELDPVLEEVASLGEALEHGLPRDLFPEGCELECSGDCWLDPMNPDGDGDIDLLRVTVDSPESAGIGALLFRVHNDGTIPARILQLNVQPFDFTNGREAFVWVLPQLDPTGQQIDPTDDPGTCRDETSAWCLVGIRVNQPGTYHFDVSADADYWTAQP